MFETVSSGLRRKQSRLFLSRPALLYSTGWRPPRPAPETIPHGSEPEAPVAHVPQRSCRLAGGQAAGRGQRHPRAGSVALLLARIHGIGVEAPVAARVAAR